MADKPIAKALRNVLVLHGPNLNLLGTREPEVYGATTLADINTALVERATARGVTLAHFQSNHEGALVDRIHAAKSEGIEFIIINPTLEETICDEHGVGVTSDFLLSSKPVTGISVRSFLICHQSNTSRILVTPCRGFQCPVVVVARRPRKTSLHG